MCDPLTIGSLALAGGSLVANKIGSDQQSAERDRVMKAENERQQGYENQSQGVFSQSIAKVQKPTTDAAVTKEAADRTASDSALIDQGGNYVPVTGSAPQEVGQSIARATKQALSRNKEQARLNANTSAVAGVNQKQGIDLGRDAQWQSIFAGNRKASSDVLPLELQDANRAGAGARGIGQILSIGSTAAGMAGLAGAGPSWGSIFGSGQANSIASPMGSAGQFGAAPVRGGWFGG